MNIGFLTRQIKEGSASIKVPEITADASVPQDRAISKAAVFYNPRMRLNRDTAVLALGVHQAQLSRPVKVCEPMSGTGVRGIRLALEVAGVERVVLGDLNPRAVRLAEENAALNGVSGRVVARLMEANLLLSMHDHPGQRFDYVDVDPYGSPAPYLDAAVRSCGDGGMLAVTATDMAPLCGVNPRACLRKYGGRPLRTEYCHEVALRLVAGALVRSAARFDVAASPVFGFAVDHYVRFYALIERGARKADRCLGEMGYVLHCFRCLNRRTVAVTELRDVGRCEVCGSRMGVTGPLWLGRLADEAFCDGMMELRNRMVDFDPRLENLINLVRDESSLPPTYYHVDTLCSRLKVESLPVSEVLSGLRGAGFGASRTHFDERGMKTDAPVTDLKGIVEEVALIRRRG